MTSQPPIRQPQSPAAKLDIGGSPGLSGWLRKNRISLAVSTYQSGKLFLIGSSSEDRLSIFERTFERCMGLWSNGQTIWMATAFQIWRMENVLDENETIDGYDRLFVPREGQITGDIDVHDLAIDANGNLVFVNTLFGCLATFSERFNFQPLWKPKFLSKITAEDRCHLNGLAMHDGKARYVTTCSQSDLAGGWREFRTDGGCVIDVETSEIVVEGFSMPHSPRLYRDKLWLLDSGNGWFGWLEPKTGNFERVSFCPGYARGLAFFEKYAFIGLSRPRREQTFSGLPLDDALDEHRQTARCGIQVVDLESGEVCHWLQFDGIVSELYDVVVLTDVLRPKAIGFKTDEIRHNVWMKEDGKINRWIGNPND